MASLAVVLNTLANSINQDLTAANAMSPLGSPWMIASGYQFSDDLAKTQGQKSGVVITLYPLKAKRDNRYLGPWYEVTAPSVGLIATVSGNQITFSGAASGGLNIHVLMAPGIKEFPTADALYQTVNTDTLNTIATAVAAAITAQGFTAAASGAVVTVSSGYAQKVNIGGTGSISQEVNRIERFVQCSIFAPTPELRNAFADALMNALTGSIAQPFLTLPDGAGAWVKTIGDDYTEQAQMSYTLYQAHITYSVEYMLENVSAATQIGAAEVTETIGSNSATTYITGG